MFDLQRASVLKRLSAALLDFILILIITVGAGWAVSAISKFDSHIDKVQEYYEYYNTKYDIDLLGTSGKYDNLTDEEQEAYNQRLQQANLEYSNDKAAIKEYGLVINLTIVIISVGVFFGIFITEFIIPLIFKNGQTIGKKIFSICVVKNDCVKMTNFQLFVRSMIGKYTIEIMIPILLFILIMIGGIGFIGTIVIAGLFITQIALLLFSKNKTVIHDAFAFTVVVDKESQKIYETEKDLIDFKTKLHEEEVKRAKEY